MRINGHQWPPASQSHTQGQPSLLGWRNERGVDRGVMVILGNTLGTSEAGGEIQDITSFMTGLVKIMKKKR